MSFHKAQEVGVCVSTVLRQIRMFRNYKTPILKFLIIPKFHINPHLSPQLMRYGKLPRFRFSFRVPLHSSYVKGDQRFAAIHQHKLPDLQGQVNNRVTFDDIQNVEDLRSSATFMTLFFLYMFYSTCSFWLIAQHNQQHPFACLIQPKALPSCHLQKHKKKPPLIT